MNQKPNNFKQPIAPPVYRPQPVPRVLQTKRPPGHTLQRVPLQPVAPPVYRPEARKIVQPKVSAQQRRPLTSAAQMKTRPVAPPVYRPQPVPKVLQAKTRNVVQRDVDVKNALKTQNGQYLIERHDNSVLYSEVSAPAPQPHGLYRRTVDQTSDMPHRLLFAWTPNVRFLSKAENRAKASKSKEGYYEYTKEGTFYDSTESFSVRDLGRAIESPAEGGQRPTLGVLGKNDCYAFGDALQNMMLMSGMTFDRSGRTRKNVHVTNPDSPRDLKIKVGDMMRHMYIDNPHCQYHAATVVAKDGKSLVTLEGHVSKDLTKPEFLIRNGVVGFARNEVLGGYGDEVEITPLESLRPDFVQSEREDYEARYKRMMGENTSIGFQQAGSNLGITRTDEHRRQEMIRNRWLDVVRQRWKRAKRAGRTSINDSDEGNEYVTNEML